MNFIRNKMAGPRPHLDAVSGTVPSVSHGSMMAWFGLLILITAAYALRWPIFCGDTDLWYHMSGGRYLFEQGEIPSTSYFSFIEPEKTWVNYYWLFQTLAYGIFSGAGYFGLIGLRAALLCLLLLILFKTLLTGEQGLRRRLYFWSMFIVFYMALIPRFLLVRPHMFSYLFIVLFLYVLECRPRRIKWLPVAGLLWVNLHGVEYPVMILICLAHLLEIMIQRFRAPKDHAAVHVNRALYLVATMWTIVLNPFGTKLFSAPFIISPHVSSYIVEMRPIGWDNLINLHWLKGILENYTALNLLLLLGLLSLIRGAVTRKVRIAHVLIAIGGFYLLTRGIRHYWEGILLCIPVLKAHPLVRDRDSEAESPRILAFLVALFLTVSAVYFVQVLPIKRLAYPVSAKKLPNGVAAFLQFVDTGGSVLNGPDNGGYLNWELYPRYRIYMDLENSIFDVHDFNFGNSALHNEAALDRFIDKYDPDYISVPYTYSGFEERIKKHESYAIVFADDTDVLYANRNKQPAVVDRYGFRTINPYRLAGTDVSKMSETEREVLLAELYRLDSLFSHVNLINQAIALIHNANQDWDQAIPYAEEIIRNAPEQETGYSIKGDSYLGMGRFQDALVLYRDALGAEPEDASRLNKKIARCLTGLGQYDEAYEALQKAISPFAVDIGYKDLYEYATAALLSEQFDEALMVYEFAARRVPLDDADWVDKINERLALFEAEEDAP